MGYVGQVVNVPLGQQGLLTDIPATQIPFTALTKATNIRYNVQGISKTPGSVKFNTTALDSGAPVIALQDWFPTPFVQRLIAITSTGKVFYDTGSGTFSAGVAIDTTFGIPTSDLMFVEAGKESATVNRKLFIFSSTHQLSYIDGSAAAVTTIANPAADWATNFPTGGFVYRDRLIAFGNANFPHQLYISPATDHREFVTGVSLISVFPGESSALTSAVVYKGKAFLFKYPTGVYLLDDQGSGTPTDWNVSKLDGAFGIASPHAAIQVLDDLIIANSTGSINSLQASQAFGDVKSSDILANAKIENFIRTQLSKPGVVKTQSIYYAEKKIAYFTFQTIGMTKPDKIIEIDVNLPNPRFAINDKDQANSLALRKDSDGIPRPIRGDNIGFVYLMDQPNTFLVAGNAYLGEFQTPDIDFSEIDPVLATKNKLFDFLSLTFTGRSSNAVSVEIFIDGQSQETISFPQTSGSTLDSFVLDTDTLEEVILSSFRKPLHGTGKRIKLRVYTTDSTEFSIENLQIEFRLGDEGNIEDTE